MPQIQAAQLIYTNVEADKSPARVRGFQLWCHSEGLPDAVVAEARRRLENFKNPDAVRFGKVVRTLFADLGPGHHLLAVTTPQETADKFGRKGRFHAHALILADAEFVKVQLNPFRVLDAFRFDESPDETMGKRRADDPRFIDPVTISCSDGTAAPGAEPNAVTAKLAKEHLPRHAAEEKDALPVCLAEKPDAVLGHLRALFDFLPATLRKAATFDTICYGSAVAANYFVVANPDDRIAPTLSGFRYYFITRQGDTRPKPPPRPPKAKLEWFPAFWDKGRDATLTDEDREAAYSFLAALHDRPGDLANLPSPSEQLLAFLSAFPEVAAAVDTLADARLRRDYARAFKAGGLQAVGQALWDGVRQMDAPAKLDFIRGGFPQGWVTRELFRALEATAAEIPAADCDAIREWLKSEQMYDETAKIHLMLHRWSTDEKAFGRCLKLLTGDEQPEKKEWFYPWCWRTVQAAMDGGKSDADTLTQLLTSPNLGAAELREWRLRRVFVARPAAAEPESEVVQTVTEAPFAEAGPIDITEATEEGAAIPEAVWAVSERPAAHADMVACSEAIDLLLEARQRPAGESFTDLLTANPEVAVFLVRNHFRSFARWNPVYVVRNTVVNRVDLGKNAVQHCLGMEVYPANGEDAFQGRLIEALVVGKPTKRLIRDRLFPFALPQKAHDNAMITPPHLRSDTVNKQVERIVSCQGEKDVELATGLIKASSDLVFLRVVNDRLMTKLTGVETEAALRPGHRYFVGWHISLIDASKEKQTLAIFDAVASSLIERRDWSDEDPVGYAGLNKDWRHRFEWLMRRLSDPIRTESAPLFN